MAQTHHKKGKKTWDKTYGNVLLQYNTALKADNEKPNHFQLQRAFASSN